MILLIDNYDSFTYNLVQYIGVLDETVKVVRNDRITVREVQKLAPDGIVISPGPGRPEDAGCSMDVIRRCADRIPILGVCLGHQCIGRVFGANVTGADRLIHGKTSEIHHDGQSIFSGVTSPIRATRYHSLIVEKNSIHSPLTVTAETTSGEVMGIRHRTKPVEGIQFHPESILTEQGHRMMRNFCHNGYLPSDTSKTSSVDPETSVENI